MEIKRVLCEVLKKGVERSTSNAKASWLTYGVEKMPESMKKRR